jgi:hypothetical protein
MTFDTFPNPIPYGIPEIDRIFGRSFFSGSALSKDVACNCLSLGYRLNFWSYKSQTPMDGQSIPITRYVLVKEGKKNPWNFVSSKDFFANRDNWEPFMLSNLLSLATAFHDETFQFGGRVPIIRPNEVNFWDTHDKTACPSLTMLYGKSGTDHVSRYLFRNQGRKVSGWYIARDNDLLTITREVEPRLHLYGSNNVMINLTQLYLILRL